MRSIRAVLVLGLALFFGSASAQSFVVSGSGGGGEPLNASAEFTWAPDYSWLEVELTNLTTPLAFQASAISGISFVVNGAPSSAFSVTSLTDSGSVNCSTGTCLFSGVLVDLPTSGWTYDGSTGLLAAGGGSFKPYEIVNDSIIVNDGIPNAQHNPYLRGPVTFHFAITGSYDDLVVSEASFYFGTGPDILTAVPEPETYAMLLAGLGLLGFAVNRRRRRQA